MLKESAIAKVNQNGYREIEKQIPQEELQAFRKKFAQIALDFWFLAESADGYIQKEEREMIMDFIKLLFQKDSLFTPEEYDELVRKSLIIELTTRGRHSFSLKEIANFARKHSKLAEAFIQDALAIIHADGRVLTKETNFLKEFMDLLGISEGTLQNMISSYKPK
ncbi:MAG: TerB family tellurite resistance protein [Candidatus Pacearchaeota archaeon]